MASLQCEIELGLLSQAERARRDWFPEWFTYTISNAEKRAWSEHLEKDPLCGAEESRFGEGRDHAPTALEPAPTRNETAGAGTPAEDRYNAADAGKVDKPGAEKYVKTSVAGSSPQQPSLPLPSSSSHPAEGPLPDLPLIYYNGQPLAIITEPTEQPQTQASSSLTTTSEASSRGQDDPPSKPGGPGAPVVRQKPCQVCSAPGKLCDGCRSIVYCCKSHQKQDWKKHKSGCKGKTKAKVS